MKNILLSGFVFLSSVLLAISVDEVELYRSPFGMLFDLAYHPLSESILFTSAENAHQKGGIFAIDRMGRERFVHMGKPQFSQKPAISSQGFFATGSGSNGYFFSPDFKLIKKVAMKDFGTVVNTSALPDGRFLFILFNSSKAEYNLVFSDAQGNITAPMALKGVGVTSHVTSNGKIIISVNKADANASLVYTLEGKSILSTLEYPFKYCVPYLEFPNHHVLIRCAGNRRSYLINDRGVQEKELSINISTAATAPDGSMLATDGGEGSLYRFSEQGVELSKIHIGSSVDIYDIFEDGIVGLGVSKRLPTGQTQYLIQTRDKDLNLIGESLVGERTTPSFLEVRRWHENPLGVIREITNEGGKVLFYNREAKIVFKSETRKILPRRSGLWLDKNTYVISACRLEPFADTGRIFKYTIHP